MVALTGATTTGAAYVVPVGKSFVLTALYSGVGSTGRMHVDDEVWAVATTSSGKTMHEMPLSVVVGEGHMIQASNSGSTALDAVPIVFGYLIDA